MIPNEFPMNYYELLLASYMKINLVCKIKYLFKIKLNDVHIKSCFYKIIKLTYLNILFIGAIVIRKMSEIGKY